MKQSFSIAKRDNNPRRDFLLINKFQSKHFPSNPLGTVRRFSDLGAKVGEAVGSAKCLVIGFSETAVGVGAYIARELGANFVATTRESILECFEQIGFEEVHSHATSHSLCVREELFSDISALVVADDEFTTGNTAVSLVEALRRIIPDNCAVYAASFAASRISEDYF
ncbi:MAG: phosphoribosyltransferase domain-containing protein, partial [Oscillospiraceae bacterium]